MTENKRFIVNDRWIKDNCIGALLNIDFNTITDANLCCDLLNQIEKEKRNDGKLASKLLEENEQLKSTIKEVIELLSDEVDLFSDEATEHDINAYMELKELDNKDAFYMATATKKAIKMLKEL